MTGYEEERCLYEIPTGPAVPCVRNKPGDYRPSRVARQASFLVNYPPPVLERSQCHRRKNDSPNWTVFSFLPDVLRERCRWEKFGRESAHCSFWLGRRAKGPGDPMLNKPPFRQKVRATWFAPQSDGAYLLPPWQGHLMNPWCRVMPGPGLSSTISRGSTSAPNYTTAFCLTVLGTAPAGLGRRGRRHDDAARSDCGNRRWDFCWRTRRNFPTRFSPATAG